MQKLSLRMEEAAAEKMLNYILAYRKIIGNITEEKKSSKGITFYVMPKSNQAPHAVFRKTKQKKRQ